MWRYIRWDIGWRSEGTGIGVSVRRKSNRLRQRPLREDFLRRKEAPTHKLLTQLEESQRKRFFSRNVCAGCAGMTGIGVQVWK